jgi:nickel-dependent lactate racemase
VDQLDATDLDGKSVCIIVPDATRSCPMPLLLKAVHGALHGRVARMTTLIALGTHQPMSERALARHLGFTAGRLEETYPGMAVVNHQ